jgi:hypothetical protein
MRKKESHTVEKARSGLSPEIEGALALLAKAHDYARQVIEDAGLLPANWRHASLIARGMGNAFVAGRSLPSPRWDPATRVLWVDEVIVKSYRVPSPNQETVLSVFQEEGWPSRIDDPLPPVPEGCAKDRLRDTIRRLNASQKNQLIRFHGDGTGEGVLWEVVDHPPTVYFGDHEQ